MAPLMITLDGNPLVPTTVRAKIGVEEGGARPIVVLLVTYAMLPILIASTRWESASRDPRTTRISLGRIGPESQRIDLRRVHLRRTAMWYDGVASFLLRSSTPTNGRTQVCARSTQQFSTLLGLIGVGVGLVGCTDKPYDPNAPAIDPNAPTVHIVTPPRGTIAGDDQIRDRRRHRRATTPVVVGVRASVNDVPAILAAGQHVDHDRAPSFPAPNLLHAIATDAAEQHAANNRERSSQVRYRACIVAQGRERADRRAGIRERQLRRGRPWRCLGATSRPPISEALDLCAAQPRVQLRRPNGPDCLYGAGVDHEHVARRRPSFTLVPQDGGLASDLDAELDSVNVGMHLQYAAACINGSRDITVAASHVSVSGNLTVGVLSGQFDIHLDSPNVTLTGFDLELGGIPGAVVDLLDINAVLGPVFGWAAEKFVVPMRSTRRSPVSTTPRRSPRSA